MPISDMIAALGMGIAQAQYELDKTSADVARMMSGIDPQDRVLFGGQSLSLIELGFTPTFYQFIESTIEVKVVVKMSRTASEESKSNTKINTSSFQGTFAWWRPQTRVQATTQTVDAKISNTYDYSTEGSSLVRTKLVPVPPPAILEERIRALMEEDAQARYQANLSKALDDIRADMVGAIENWVLPAEPVIHSLSDLRALFLDDSAHEPYRKKVAEFPEILQDTVIHSKFVGVFDTYRNTLKTEIDTALGNWLLSETEIFDTMAETRSFFFGQQPLRLDARYPELSQLLNENTIDNKFKKHYNFGKIMAFAALWEPSNPQKISATTVKEIENAFIKAVESAPALHSTGLVGKVRESQTLKDRITFLMPRIIDFNVDKIVDHAQTWAPQDTQNIEEEEDIVTAFFKALEAKPDAFNLRLAGIEAQVRDNDRFKLRISALFDQIQAAS